MTKRETVTFLVSDELLSLQKELRRQGVTNRNASSCRDLAPEDIASLLHYNKLAEHIHREHLLSVVGTNVQVHSVLDIDLTDLIGQAGVLKRVFKKKASVEIDNKKWSFDLDGIAPPTYAVPSMYMFLFDEPLPKHYRLERVETNPTVVEERRSS